jgi:hypothetical protein
MATTATNGSLNGNAGNRASAMLSNEQIKELSELFDTVRFFSFLSAHAYLRASLNSCSLFVNGGFPPLFFVPGRR